MSRTPSEHLSKARLRVYRDYYKGLREATRSGTEPLTQPRYLNMMERMVSTFKREACPEARRMLDLWASDRVVPEVREDLRLALTQRGYPVPVMDRKHRSVVEPAVVERIIQGNVTEVDRAFAALLEKASVPLSARSIVGMIDSACDTEHVALARKLSTDGWNFWSNSPNVREGRDIDHGTHGAGLITAGTEQVQVLPLNVFDAQEFIGDAIDHAASHGARTISLTFSVEKPEDIAATLEAIRRHPEVMFIKSAGQCPEGGRTLDATVDPERFLVVNQEPNLLVVSWADERGLPDVAGNHGAPYVVAGAPGSHVLSTVSGQRENYLAMSGSSQSAFNTASLVARTVLLDPGLSVAQRLRLLERTVDRSPAWTGKARFGGVWNPGKATRAAALTGLLRKGVPPELAADRLELAAAERVDLLTLARELAPGT